MRFVLKNIVLYALSLFTLQLLFTGVSVNGGIETYIVGALILTILFYTLKPILQLVTLPLNFATLGLFTIIINTLILYIATVLIPNIVVTAFTYPGVSFLGFTVPVIQFNAFFAYVICAIVISCLTTVILWLFE
ncbi:MAG: phage holin family protein [Candidatus Levybacteria bacterium]|nr:phage holin family protein [Candidatus Levybacteria bacterium]